MKISKSLVIVGLAILTVSMALLSAKEITAKDGFVTVRIPVLSECLKDTKERISRYPSNMDVKIRYIPFDRQLFTHPSLVGYLELTSSKWDKSYLVRTANGFRTGCDIDATAFFDMNGKESDWEIFQYINGAKRQGSDVVYLVVKDNGIEMLYKGQHYEKFKEKQDQ